MPEDAFGYVHEDQREIIKTRWDISQRKNILVVDDICDTGKTFQDIELYGFQTAALFLRLDSPFKPELFSRISEDDSWIVFPWERKDARTLHDSLASLPLLFIIDNIMTFFSSF